MKGKKKRKIIINTIRAIDYLIFVLVFPLCLVIFLFSIPWILKQRGIWKDSAKGNNKALIIQPFSLEKLKNQGFELILPFRNPTLKWIGFLDPANPLVEDKIEVQMIFI